MVALTVIALGVVVLALVFVGALSAPEGGPRQPTLCLLATTAFLSAGLVSLWRRPQEPMGAMLVLAAALMAMQFGVGDRYDSIDLTVGLCALGTAGAAVVTLVAAAPDGRLQGRVAIVLAAAAVVFIVVSRPLDVLTVEPREDSFYDDWPAENLLRIGDAPPALEWLPRATGWVVLVLLVAAVGLQLSRAARVTAPARHRPLLAAAGGAILAGEAAISQVIHVDGVRRGFVDVMWPLTLPEALLMAAAPWVLVAAQLSTRLTRARIGRLLADLDATPGPGGLRDALSRALGDPTLRVGLWTGSRYVDEDGRALAAAGPADTTTPVDDHDGPLAVLVHDAVLREDQPLVGAVTGAARLALERERLYAEVQAQLAEVRASRARIVAATDRERRQIERDLHDGAQQRLVSVALGFQVLKLQLDGRADGGTAAVLDEAAREADLAIDELRELSRGIFPPVLEEQGLAAALQALGERSAIPVTVRAQIDRRLPAVVERASYFLCSEGLSHAIRSHAGEAALTADASEKELRLELRLAVAPTPADAETMRDRVEALGGRLEVTGAVLRASVPFDGR
jgi:signal transduction histidine kinase